MDITAEAVAGFAAGVINDHVFDSDGCCAGCCAPCSALAWLRDYRRDELDSAITEWLGTDWDWQTDGQVNWAAINPRLTCASNPPCGEKLRSAYRGDNG